MTYEEALKDLESIHYTKHGLYTDDSFAYEMAFEALNKQISKKPLDKRHYGDDPFCIALCPCCGDGVNESMNFCDQCGQKLDWRNA